MKGSVISRDINGITIALSHNTEDSCAACGLGESCSLPKSETIHVDFSKQTEGLKINDNVDVEISPKKLVWLSAIVYIFPVFLMISGAVIGSHFSEIFSIIGAVAGLIIGLIINIKLDKVSKMSNIIIIRRVQ